MSDTPTDRETVERREVAFQEYINEVTPNGNARLDNILTCAHPASDKIERHIETQINMAFQAGWSAALRALASEGRGDGLAERIEAAARIKELEARAEVAITLRDNAERERNEMRDRAEAAEAEVERLREAAIAAESWIADGGHIDDDDALDGATGARAIWAQLRAALRNGDD